MYITTMSASASWLVNLNKYRYSLLKNIIRVLDNSSLRSWIESCKAFQVIGWQFIFWVLDWQLNHISNNLFSLFHKNFSRIYIWLYCYSIFRISKRICMGAYFDITPYNFLFNYHNFIKQLTINLNFIVIHYANPNKVENAFQNSIRFASIHLKFLKNSNTRKSRLFKICPLWTLFA